MRSGTAPCARARANQASNPGAKATGEAPATQVEALAAVPTPLSSEQLLQGRSTVDISHHGVLYRLRQTRQGKLILTK